MKGTEQNPANLRGKIQFDSILNDQRSNHETEMGVAKREALKELHNRKRHPAVDIVLNRRVQIL